MAFQTIPINVTGPSYKDRSRPLVAQETRNFYHEVVESGKDTYVLKSFPGQKLLGSADSGNDRGMHKMLEVPFRVIDNTLYSINSSGIHTALGEIPGIERCIFADDGINLFIVAEEVVSHWDGSSITTVTDANIDGAKSVTFINNQFAYTKDRFTTFSNVGDGTTASGLNIIGAEYKPDNLVYDYAFLQILYRFGTESIESWYNSGVGKPPFSRIEGQVFNIGLIAKHSVTESRDFIYWLGSDKQVYRARGGQEQVVSSGAIAQAIQGYTIVSDAFSETFVIDDKTFFMLTFPTAGKTWLLNEALGLDGWLELSAGVVSGGISDSNILKYNAGSILEAFGKVLIGDDSNGELYELDFNTFDQHGEPWQRRRVLASINADLLGQKGKRVQMSRLELILEKGVGLISGQGEDPKIMIEYSVDGGRTWLQGTWMRIGRLGEFNIRAEWWALNSFYDMIIRITTSDPVSFNIYSGAIDLRLAGR